MTLIRTNSDGTLLILTGARRRVTIAPGALENAEAVGLDIDRDIDTMIDRIARLPITDEDGIAEVRARFLADCLDGADAERAADWPDYVDAVMSVATGPDDREP